jgi:CTP:molybdopterin cytidylyltransferase MocA
MTTAAAILAAGAGSRFGRDDADGSSSTKLRVELRGKPLVLWAIEHALHSDLDELIIVVADDAFADLVPSGLVVVPNAHWADGIATSLQCAIATADEHGHDAVVVGLGDQPFVSSTAWSAVAAADRTPIAVATYDGLRRNPVRISREVWPWLPTSGDEGARVLMADRPDLVTEVPCDGNPVDIDIREDLSRWS